MAVVKKTHILHGYRGMIGKSLVFRMVNGKTIVSAAPVRKAPYNAAQQKQQNRFKEAMAYATTLLADKDTKDRYTAMAKARGRGLNAYNIVISEYLNSSDRAQVHESSAAAPAIASPIAKLRPVHFPKSITPIPLGFEQPEAHASDTDEKHSESMLHQKLYMMHGP